MADGTLASTVLRLPWSASCSAPLFTPRSCGRPSRLRGRSVLAGGARSIEDVQQPRPTQTGARRNNRARRIKAPSVDQQWPTADDLMEAQREVVPREFVDARREALTKLRRREGYRHMSMHAKLDALSALHSNLMSARRFAVGTRRTCGSWGRPRRRTCGGSGRPQGRPRRTSSGSRDGPSDPAEPGEHESARRPHLDRAAAGVAR